MKKLISLLLVCFLMFSLCACGDEPTLVGSGSGSNNPNNNSSVSDQTFKLGDSVELGDIVVTFVGISKSTGSTYNKPEDGKVFLLCEFEIVNNSNSEITVSSMLSFEAYCDDYSCEYSLGALLEKGSKDQLDGSVAAGKKIKGVIGYEVPTNWQKLEIQYAPDLLSNDKIIFIATNN